MEKKVKKTKSKAKKVVAKTTKKSVKKSVKKTVDKYFYAVGRRKSATAQIRLFPTSKSSDGDLIVNDRKIKKYFPKTITQDILLNPLKETGVYGKFKFSALVKGGGITGQAEAIRLGIARALVKFDDQFRAILKANGFLTRDSRVVERKKPGLKKARRAPQWSKR
jgi:small subunit ribosomal protein S9